MKLKILVFFLACSFLSAMFLGAYWFYTNVDQPEAERLARLHERRQTEKKHDGPDPARPHFEQALKQLSDGQVDAAHSTLSRLIQIYRDSDTLPQARRILGEINLDWLYSRTPRAGKKEYTVQAGDSISKIEQKCETTFACLMQTNQLTSAALQLGEKLVYEPLHFELVLDLSAKKLTLYRPGTTAPETRFFREYALSAINWPPNLSKKLTTKIQQKAGFIGEKKIAPTDPRYPTSRKWIQTEGKGNRIGLLIRPHSEHEASRAALAPDDEDLTYGVFLADADLEELTTLVRPGFPLTTQ